MEGTLGTTGTLIGRPRNDLPQEDETWRDVVVSAGEHVMRVPVGEGSCSDRRDFAAGGCIGFNRGVDSKRRGNNFGELDRIHRDPPERRQGRVQLSADSARDLSDRDSCAWIQRAKGESGVVGESTCNHQYCLESRRQYHDGGRDVGHLGAQRD